MNRRFPLLSTLTVILITIGWILLGIGVLMLVSTTGGRMVIGLTLAPSGVLLVAFGESIRVGLAIEQNTRDASEALTEMRDAMRSDLQRDKAKPAPKT